MKLRRPPEPSRAGELGALPASSAELQAAEWLVRLQDTDLDPEEPHPDPLERHAAFMEWLQASPANLPAFRMVLGVDGRAQGVDGQRLIDIQALLRKHAAELAASAIHPHAYQDGAIGNAVMPTDPSAPARSRKVVAAAAVGAVVLIALGARYALFGADIYETGVGEQLSRKLGDGSVILLNTDTRIEVHFSMRARDVRLVRGEAFFKAEHDGDRPFTVVVGDAAVVALGTDFGVRRQVQSTDVVVVAGKVRVSASEKDSRNATESDPVHRMPRTTSPSVPVNGKTAQGKSTVTIVTAGESVQITGGTVTKGNGNVADALAWRQKQLVFRDTPLADIAAEFNRYNHSQIRVEGQAAGATRITGIFDPRDLQRMLLIARNHEALLVEPDGRNWVIRSRQTGHL